MTGPSVQLPTAWLQSDELEDLGADVVLLMLTALAYCADQTDDGWVGRRRLSKLWPIDDVEDAIERLVKGGEVEDHGERVLFVHWRQFILSQDEVDEIRAGSRERSERSRRHKRGDHSMCRPSYCNAARSRHNERDATRDDDGTVRVSDGLPIRTDPTRPQGRGGEEGGAGSGSAGAPPDQTPHEFREPPDQGDPCCAFCGLGDLAIVHWAHDFVPSADPDDDGCTECGERETSRNHHWSPAPRGDG